MHDIFLKTATRPCNRSCGFIALCASDLLPYHCTYKNSLDGQIRSPPRLEIIEREDIVDAVTLPIELRERFS